MKFDASVLHSEGYFLEVKPIYPKLETSKDQWQKLPIITGIPPMRQKLSNTPRSLVTSYQSAGQLAWFPGVGVVPN